MAGTEASAALDHGDITIGRGAGNDWVLPDPEKLLSKTHCRIDFVGDHYAITDTSTNGVFINGAAAPLGRGNSAVLSDGDRLTLGHYEINVQLTASPAPSRALGDPEAGLGDLDPFEVGTDAGTDDPFGQPSAPGASGNLPSGLLTDVGRGDVDPLADLGSEQGVEAGGWSGPFAEEPPGGSSRRVPPKEMIPQYTNLISNLGLGEEPQSQPPEDHGGSEPDHVASVHEFFQPPNVLQEQIPDDWDGEEDEQKETGEEAAPAAQPRRQSERAASDQALAETVGNAPPVSEVGEEGAAVVASARPKKASGSTEAALVTAFLAGAGLSALDMGKQDPAELMRSLGEVLRAMVEGLRETLMARSTIKNELRLERTVIQATGNNPLKFSANLEEALAAIVQPMRSGYLPPTEAVKDGFDDLKAHQIATLTGMQVALSALLGEFDPETLKQRLEHHSVLHSLLPAARKAKYWEMYEALYKEIAKDAADSFNGRYAREFARAYDEQVRKL